jgi:hypothetical protein
LYSAVRGFAELVDGVLLDLKSGTPEERGDRRRQLGNLLIRVADATNRDVNSNVFRVLVRDSSKGHFDLGQVGKQLLADDAGTDSIDKLEVLAAILENERTSMLGRMRGR